MIDYLNGTLVHNCVFVCLYFFLRPGQIYAANTTFSFTICILFNCGMNREYSIYSTKEYDVLLKSSHLPLVSVRIGYSSKELIENVSCRSVIANVMQYSMLYGQHGVMDEISVKLQEPNSLLSKIDRRFQKHA